MMQTSPNAPGRRALTRWLVAGVATLLLMVSGSGLVAFAQTGAGTSTGPTFLPEDTPIYLELRADMPDGQKEALAEMLSAFPGFADTASFDILLDQALDGLVSEATGGALSWQEDVRTWLAGEISLGVLDLAEAMASGEDPGILAGLKIKDSAALDAFIDATVLADPLATVSDEPYGDTNILSDGSSALAATDELLLVSNSIDLIKRGLDVLAGTEPSLAAKASFAKAFARVPAGHLAAAFMDFSAMLPLIEAAMAASGDAAVSGLATNLITGLLPTDMTMYLAAAPDHLELTAFLTPGPEGSLPTIGESDLATVFPEGTQIYIELRDLGATLGQGLEMLVSQVLLAEDADREEIDGLLGAPLPDFLSFIGDAAVGGAYDENGISLGIAAEVDDEAVAAKRVERLLTFVRLAAAGSETEIAIDDTDVDGTTVTTITLPLDEEMTVFGLPIDPNLSVAVADGHLLIGLGDFVSNALQGDPSVSLATSPGYSGAVTYAGSPNGGLAYADLAGLLTALEPLLSDSITDYETSIKPYLDALRSFVVVSGLVDDLPTTRMALFVG